MNTLIVTRPVFSTATNKVKLLLSLAALLFFLCVELRMLSNANDDFIQALSSEVFLLQPMKKLNQVGQLGSNFNQTKHEVQFQDAAVTSTHHSEEVAEEYPGPPELMHDMNESFSACLLVMDDNFRLYEWIAYHYHVLPLRYLVVAADSRSKNFPNAVLDVFRQQLNMTIVSWNDSDYISWDEPLRADAGVLEKKYRHQYRQRSFLAKCLRHMHQHRRTWTALWDVDEFIAFNGYNWTRQNAATNLSATSPQDMSELGSILRYLKEFGEDKGLSMKRILVGSLEIPSLMNESHPFDPRRFDTLRYRFRAKNVNKLNGQGKCMLNVQKISSFPVRVRNPHRPVLEICPGAKGERLVRNPFFLHHFIGSWEAYSYRDDGRRGSEKTYKAYVERAQQSGVYENKISHWMPAFVENVGKVRARVLLQNAGLDPEYNASFKIDDFKVVNLTW
ncbi:hypothetical protein MHU86_7525 [Fragilaria crotonensis]|nr:hypothetical protein MHU86_7525 [Fragilaria crotonensis]